MWDLNPNTGFQHWDVELNVTLLLACCFAFFGFNKTKSSSQTKAVQCCLLPAAVQANRDFSNLFFLKRSLVLCFALSA